MTEKKQPVRKLPKKSKRPKRRYVLFGLKPGSCSARQAFDLVMGQFSLEQRKRLGLWFIGFEPETGKGIVRCILGAELEARKGIESMAKQFEPKTVKTSGTLRALEKK
jgi:RNase P/RNase MRP subunit POP5